MKKTLLPICIFACLWMPALTAGDDGQSGSAAKKIVMILPERLFHDSEFTILKEVFQRGKLDILVASSKLTDVVGYGGLRATPEILVQDIDTNTIDALVFIGGAGCLQYCGDYHARRICKQVHRDNKILAAIHVAPRILAEFGLLKGRRIAGTAVDALVEKGAILSDRDVERDGNIITAYGPHVAEAFGELIVSALKD